MLNGPSSGFRPKVASFLTADPVYIIEEIGGAKSESMHT